MFSSDFKICSTLFFSFVSFEQWNLCYRLKVCYKKETEHYKVILQESDMKELCIRKLHIGFPPLQDLKHEIKY
jgi:hypothetical protein